MLYPVELSSLRCIVPFFIRNQKKIPTATIAPIPTETDVETKTTDLVRTESVATPPEQPIFVITKEEEIREEESPSVVIIKVNPEKEEITFDIQPPPPTNEVNPLELLIDEDSSKKGEEPTTFVAFFNVKEKKVIPVDKEAFTKKDIDLLKTFGTVRSQPEFSAFFPKKEETASQSEDLYHYLVQFKGRVDFPDVYEACLKILFFEKNEEKKKLAQIFIIPYLFKFFETKGMKENFDEEKKLLENEFDKSNLSSEVASLKKHLPYLMDQGLIFLEPFIKFFAEQSDNKNFLYDFVYNAFFSIFSYIVKDELKKLRKSEKTPLQNNIESCRKWLPQFSEKSRKEVSLALERMELREKEREPPSRFIILF